METENKIIVIYVGVAGIRSEDIDVFVREVTKRIVPSSVKAEFISIPVQSCDTRMECINPKYITEPELIQKHTELMKELHDEITHQIEEIKRKNGEEN